MQMYAVFGSNFGANAQSWVVGSACSFLAGKDSDGSGDARVAPAVRKNPQVLGGMPDKVLDIFDRPLPECGSLPATCVRDTDGNLGRLANAKRRCVVPTCRGAIEG